MRLGRRKPAPEPAHLREDEMREQGTKHREALQAADDAITRALRRAESVAIPNPVQPRRRA
jgi:hypothetical protein